jgi:integrase
MGRPKKPKYEYVQQLGQFRKRVLNEDGKYVAVYGKTPDELEEKIYEFKRAVQFGVSIKSNPLVSDYAQKWMDLHAPSLTFGSAVDYQSIIKNHIIKPLGSKHMKEIKPDDIKYAMGLVSDKSESVHNKTYMLLKQIFTSAEENGIIEHTPCKVMHNGGKEPKGREALTNEQVKVLLDSLKGTKAYVFCMIAVFSGLRREEILGLQWDCVYLDETPRIIVKRALRFEHNQPVISEKLKSKAAKRTIPIPTQLSECLKEQKAISRSEYVITNTSDGPMSGTQYRNLWHAVVCRMAKERTYTEYRSGGIKEVRTISPKLGEKAKCRKHCYTIDFEVTPHILRHTYITNLLLAGVDVKTVQYLAGHEKAKITLDIYAHLTYNQPGDLARKVNGALENLYNPGC